MSVAAASQSFVASQSFAAKPRKVRARPTRTIAWLVLMVLALTLGIQRVVLAATPDGSGHGALVVQGVDGKGRMSSSADVIAIDGAYPGMEAKTSTFEIGNTGTLPVAFAVTSADLATNGAQSLDDVLRIVVRDPSTGDTVFRGRLSGLHIAHTGVLEAGAAARFTVKVTWPSTPADDAYQGAGLGFSVVASPAAA